MRPALLLGSGSIMLGMDEWCMDLCDLYARRSKDVSTKLGCVIMAPPPGRQLLSAGYNSFVRGINDDVPERQQRPEKYLWMAHAEANAIWNACRSGVRLAGGVIYCQWLPCPTCAMGIIQVGIKCIVVRTFDVPPRWQGDMRVAVTMLHEAGVGIRLVGCMTTHHSIILEQLSRA